MTFEEALQLLKEGKKIRRKIWREYGNGRYLELVKQVVAKTPESGTIENYEVDDGYYFEDWEEYKEPLLTEEEKEYLRMIIKFHPDSEEITYMHVYKDRHGFNLVCLCYCEYYESCYYVSLNYFKNLENGMTYTLEELGV